MRAAALLGCGVGLALVVLGLGCAGPKARREAKAAVQLAGEPTREQVLDAREIMARTTNRPVGAVMAVQLGKSLCGRVLGETPSLGLAVVSLGARDGLRKDDLLLLFRYDRFLSKAMVEQVLPEKSTVRCAPLGLEGPPVPVPQHAATTPEDPWRGRVIGVDKNLRIVVFDLGEQQGVKKGDEVTVARGDAFLASVTVFDVMINKSSARLDRRAKEIPIVGDEVIRKRGTR